MCVVASEVNNLRSQVCELKSVNKTTKTSITCMRGVEKNHCLKFYELRNAIDLRFVYIINFDAYHSHVNKPMNIQYSRDD